MIQSNVGTVEVDEAKPVDREKTCPLLLRVFVANGRHNNLSEYHRGSVPANELQIYTWMDCSLRELTSLIKEVNPDARRKGTVYDFSVVSPDIRLPEYRLRDVGSTCSGTRGLDDNKTLAALKFEIGDYIDVAITVPGMRPPPPADTGFGGRGGREGGYGGGGGGGYGGGNRFGRGGGGGYGPTGRY